MNPRFSVHTADKTSPRGFSWIWFLRVAQAVVSLIVLGLAATNISGLSGSGCSVPGKMAWNLACAALALIALAYLLFSSGTLRLFKLLPWWIFIQLGLDALMFIFWIAAAGTSHFTCFDLCSTCDGWGLEIWFDRLDCLCESNYIYYEKRGMSPNPGLGLGHGAVEKRRNRYSKAGRSTGTLVAREAMDAVMVVLFFITLGATAWWIWQNRKAGSTTTGSSAPGANSNNPESGVQQVPMEMKQDAPYTAGPGPQNPNNLPQQYTNGVPQQQQQQPGNYAPMSPGSPGGYPQQGYPQQQQPQPAYQQQQQGYSPQAQYPQQQQGQDSQQQQYPPQQQQQYPSPQQQQQSYPEQPQQSAQGYYGGPGAQQQQQDIPNYPTPTPEMQAGHGGRP